MSVFFFDIFTNLLYFLDSTYKFDIIQYLSFSGWFITLSISSVLFSHSVMSNSLQCSPNPSMLLQMAKFYSILWLSCIPLCGMKLKILNIFIHLSADGHWGCFLILAIVNNATMNTGMHVSFQISDFVFFGYTRSGIAESHGSSISSFFEKPPYFFPQWLHQFIFPPTV